MRPALYAATLSLALGGLVGCDSAQPAREGPSLTSGPSSPTSTEISESIPALGPEPLNADAVELGRSLLRLIGAREIGEAEHGFKSASMSGVLGTSTVLVWVTPKGQPAVRGDVVETWQVGSGVEVRTLVVNRHETLLRFRYGRGGYTIDLAVLDEDFELSLPQARSLVSGLFRCPSECGDLPPGADE